MLLKLSLYHYFLPFSLSYVSVGPPWDDFVGSSLYLLNVDFCFLSQVQEVLSYYFFK